MHAENDSDFTLGDVYTRRQTYIVDIRLRNNEMVADFKLSCFVV